MQNWLNLKFYKYLYYNSQETNQFLNQNYFIGENRMRITLRRIQLQET